MVPGEDTCGSDVMDSTVAPQVEYHEPSGSYRAMFDQRTRSATDAVIAAVAAAAETDPLELPPLWSVLDPDALDGLVDSSTHERDHARTVLTFEYAAHAVTVNGHGTVIVESIDESLS